MPGLQRAGYCAVAAAVLLAFVSATAGAQLMIVGNDEKQGYDPNIHEAGHDTLSIVDISKPATPRVAATIPLMNSIQGPPTNLAIHQSGEIALVANSVIPGPEKDGKPTLVSDDKVFVIDLKANPPKQIDAVAVGKKPSGLAIGPKGDMALVANRDDGTVSVLSIKGKDVKAVGSVVVGAGPDQVSAVAIAPDGKRALALKSTANKVAVLGIDGEKVSYDKTADLPTGIYPYNVVITPDSKLAIVADTGNGGSSDGHADTVSVIDLEANPPRVIDHITVGDSPEGLVLSPRGDLVVTIEARGSNRPKDTWYYHPGGAVTVLKIDGKQLTKTGEATVGALPEGGSFSADGSYLYIGNFIDQDMSVLKMDGGKLTDTGQRLKLPGHPASVRAGPQ
jgi:DNA-binding beta-propeller fold protein YncE